MKVYIAPLKLHFFKLDMHRSLDFSISIVGQSSYFKIVTYSFASQNVPGTKEHILYLSK
jgi:hypothetical protein